PPHRRAPRRHLRPHHPRRRAPRGGATTGPRLVTVVDRAPSAAGTASAAPTTAISCRGVSKTFSTSRSSVMALDGVDLEVRTGEIVCVVGASGCGKSTLLNLVAGLDAPSRGEVATAGRTALMFQDAALFPWLTVSENVGLPLRLAGIDKAARRARVE